MGRPAKPYKKDGWYITRLGGRTTKLCRISEGKTQALRALAFYQEDLENTKTVTQLFKLFLDQVKIDKAPATHANYEKWCHLFEKSYGGRLIKSITKNIAVEFVNSLRRTNYKPKSVNHAIISVRRAFNWAIEMDYLPVGGNPFTKMKLLYCEGRKRVATAEEFEKLLNACDEENFKHVLLVMRLTSARPQDICNLTWDMVKWDDNYLEIPMHKASHTQRIQKPRILGICKQLRDILESRKAANPHSEYVFLTQSGTPWLRNNMSFCFRKLRKRADIKADAYGEELVLYTLRHTFLTAAGRDPTISGTVLQGIAGHTDARTTARYIHHGKQIVADASAKVAENIHSKEN